jgi:hypothetical protein
MKIIPGQKRVVCTKFDIYAAHPINYARVGILFISSSHLHDRIISLSGEVWPHKTSVEFEHNRIRDEVFIEKKNPELYFPISVTNYRLLWYKYSVH